jgi:hypothetical protein
MSDFYKKVSEFVRRRGGIVGPLQLWQVVNDQIVRWDDSLGTQPTQEELKAITIPDTLLTAEQIVAKHFTPYQIAALQRLELALIQSNKSLGPKMLAAKTWLESVLLAWAMNPQPVPENTFGNPNVTFEEASAEAVAALTSHE